MLVAKSGVGTTIVEVPLSLLLQRYPFLTQRLVSGELLPVEVARMEPQERKVGSRAAIMASMSGVAGRQGKWFCSFCQDELGHKDDRETETLCSSSEDAVKQNVDLNSEPEPLLVAVDLAGVAAPMSK